MVMVVMVVVEGVVVLLWWCFGRVVPSDGFQVVFQGWCSGDVSVVLFVFVGVF